MKKNLFQNYFEKSSRVIKSIAEEEKTVKLIIQNIKDCINNNKKIFMAPI